MNFTKEQNDAIYQKGSNILVAAAAGSGKTAVLVERIIQKILKDGIDIDKLLVVTFTNAAASEMREKILEAIYQKLEEEPDNLHLQRQVNLISRSSICTIHSFCLEVIKNHFFEIDISPNFRIGSEEEITLMKQEVLEDLFERKYEEEEIGFLKLIDCYAEYRGDEKLQELVLKVYDFASSAAFPEEWLQEKVEMFCPENQKETDFSKTVWGQILVKELKEITTDAKDNIKSALEITRRYEELEMYTTILEETLGNLKAFYEKLDMSWNEAFSYYHDTKIFVDWKASRKITLEAKEEAKDLKDSAKKRFSERIEKYLTYSSEEAFRDIYAMYDVIKALGKLVIDFNNAFQQEKKERNVIDFNDIEHYALNILVKKDENGQYVPTEVAKNYAARFEEIAIDEYQDSNNVQEQLLTSIARGNNIFAVGDVKQSIYRFRRACPELFLKKYHQYSLTRNENGLKIQLFKNFRSRENILNITNAIFESIMTEKLGEMDYTEEEFLNLGAIYEEKENRVTKSEILVVDNAENEINEELEIEEVEEDTENEYDANGALEEIKDLKKEELEARLVTKKVKEILNSKVLISDRKLGYRSVQYKDIVILLRSTKFANIYEKELVKNGIPVFTDGADEYLDTVEIQTIMNVLKLLDNPLEDIAVVSVLRSSIFGFTDNEIVEIRLVNRDIYFWDSLLQASKELENMQLKEKILTFLDRIEQWKEKKEYLPISELLWKIYVETGFFNYVSLMPNGSLRQANLKILFERAKDYEKTSFKGLFQFIRFIEKLKSGSSDLSSAKIIGENEDVVRIMSIHKSKGLEFPIVFLCNSSKKMNTEDLKGNVLLHKDLGFGPKLIDVEKKIEYPTYSEDAMKICLRDEAISEEMRVLYVALTRAKEKLIVTAIRKNEAQELEKKKQELKIYFHEKRISPALLKKKTSYLDWMEYVILNYELQGKDFEHFQFSIIDAKDLKELETSEDITNAKMDFTEYDDFKELEEKLNWKYENTFLSNLPIKTSVSALKQMQKENFGVLDLTNQAIEWKEIIPKFLQEDRITAARIGTLTHLLLQKIDFHQITSKEDVREEIEKLVAKGFMEEQEAQSISVQKVLDFLNSDFATAIKQAKKVYKEQPFCVQIEAKQIWKDLQETGKILVQGIIDMYYEKEDGNLVLVDYKTDYVENGEEELIDKYKVQLDLYRQALEEGTHQKVEKVYIYSLYLNKAIEIH